MRFTTQCLVFILAVSNVLCVDNMAYLHGDLGRTEFYNGGGRVTEKNAEESSSDVQQKNGLWVASEPKLKRSSFSDGAGQASSNAPVLSSTATTGCAYTLCISKVTPSSNSNVRNYYATYNGYGSILLFWKFVAAESGVSVASPVPIQRGEKGEAHIVMKIDSQVTDLLIFSAEITASVGSTWSIPAYSWVYAALWNSLCLDNGDVCLAETMTDDHSTRIVTALNYRYVECSIKINVTASTNTQFTLFDGTAFSDSAVFVVPKRNQGSPPTPVYVYTAKQINSDDGWMYSFEFYGRRGDFRISPDNYLYDVPLIGRYGVNQGYGGLFSHTGWSQYAIDWNVSIGTPIYSVRDGVVVGVKEDQWLSKFDPGVCPGPVTDSCATPGSDANSVIVRHQDGTWAMYAHLKQNGVMVTEGQTIKGKTLLGFSGNTGFSSGPHLHFQVTKAAKFDNSLGWISETLYVQYVDRAGNVYVPKAGNTYSATTYYPKQISDISPTVIPPFPPVATTKQVNASNVKQQSADPGLFASFFGGAQGTQASLVTAVIALIVTVIFML